MGDHRLHVRRRGVVRAALPGAAETGRVSEELGIPAIRKPHSHSRRRHCVRDLGQLGVALLGP